MWGSIILYYMRTRAWDSKMCNVCNVCNVLTNMSTHYGTVCNASSLRALLFWHTCQINDCKYATTTIFLVLYCIFSDFVHFTLKLFKILYYLCTRIRHLSRIADTAPLNRRATKASALPNEDASHAHRTFIALPSHTQTRVNNKRTWCFLQMQVEF